MEVVLSSRNCNIFFRKMLNLDLHQATFSNFVSTYRIQIRLDVHVNHLLAGYFLLKLQIFLNVDMFKNGLIPCMHHVYHFTFVYLSTVENLTHLIHTFTKERTKCL